MSIHSDNRLLLSTCYAYSVVQGTSIEEGEYKTNKAQEVQGRTRSIQGTAKSLVT